MATITVSQTLDSAARTAGEAMTINSNAVLTVDTDTRWHANSPASMTGSLGTLTVNEGEFFVDATKVRWLAYDTGSGNVPAIGTAITQGAISGVLLGVYATIKSAPTAVGAAMPATGFLKFKSVTGGAFSVGVLAGISASATGADTLGWLEVVFDQLANLTINGLGKFKSRGGYFKLGTTSGVRGQVFECPTNGGGANTLYPGCFIEKVAGAGTDPANLDCYPALNGATYGWSITDLGVGTGLADERQKFCKMLPNGGLQLGESQTQSGTYASLAAQASTYASVTETGTYTWENDVVTVTINSGVSHFLDYDMQVGLQITSGGATSGVYTATVLDPFTFTVPLAGSGAGGAVSCRSKALVTFATSGLNDRDKIYAAVTSGTLPSGNYDIFKVSGTASYWIKYPHTAVLTSGNVSVWHSLTITSTAHGLSMGRKVYCNFTSGGGVSGNYIIRTTTANTYTIDYVHSSTVSGDVTVQFDIGYVPPSGRGVYIPNSL